jgi:geranylgeranyl diphosphate synthase type I
MSLQLFSEEMLPAIEHEMHLALNRLANPNYKELRHMLAYHLGWEGESAGPDAQGKRIRPLLVLLVCAAGGGDWKKALPAATAVELIHNFSLIHDDIEDNSPLRRGRPTVWKRWGVPQAINAGDAMFSLAHLALLDLQNLISPKGTVTAMRILDETCVHLTQGQYLDISFESRGEVSLGEYWEMIGGKTAALLSACTTLGAIAAVVNSQAQASYQMFGQKLGLAFQALDDLLGIWGSTGLIGKSTESDLLTGKKSLPVLYGLEKDGPFARRWRQGNIVSGEVAGLAQQLEREGGRSFAQAEADRLTREAMQALAGADPKGPAGQALHELAERLLHRQH